MTRNSPPSRVARIAVLTFACAGTGCMALTPQLSPTDFASLERIEDRDAREKAYADGAIYRHDLPQGTRYTKGTSVTAEKRSWQSLDAILRSDAAAFESLPHRKLRLARLFTALGVATSLVTVAGIAASAREGLDLQRLDGTGGLLLGGGLASVALGITAGILFTRARKDYDRAVDVYNDSLGVRLGLYTADGKYIPPRGALVDKDGYILLDDAERANEAPTGEEGPDAPATDAPATDAPATDAPSGPQPETPPAVDAPPSADVPPPVVPPEVPVLRPSGSPGPAGSAAIRLQMR